jgi:hypothetical protein
MAGRCGDWGHPGLRPSGDASAFRLEDGLVDPGRGMVKRSSVYRLRGRHNWSRRKLMMFTLSSPLTTVRSLERLGTNERGETPVSFARPFWISQGRCSCTGHIHSTRLAPAPPRNEPLATELAGVSSPSCSQKGSCHQCGGYLSRPCHGHAVRRNGIAQCAAFDQGNVWPP